MQGSGGQTYVERPPVAALADLVSAVWVQEVAPDAEPYTHRNIPNGAVELLCPVGATPRILGPLTRPLVEVLEPGAIVVGLRLGPGAAPSVLGLPASELVDLALDADELWGDAAVALGERVDGSASPEEALAALQRGVAGRLDEVPRPDPVISEAVRQLMPWGSTTSARSPTRCSSTSASCAGAARPRSGSRRRRCTACCASRGSLRSPSTRARGHDHTASFGPLLRSRPTAA